MLDRHAFSVGTIFRVLEDWLWSNYTMNFLCLVKNELRGQLELYMTSKHDNSTTSGPSYVVQWLFLYILNIDLGIIGNWLTFSVGATDLRTVLPHHRLQLTPPSLSYLYCALFMSSISPSTFTTFEPLNFIMSYPSLQFWYNTVLYDSMVPTYPPFTFVFFLTITLTGP